ncbi:AbrB/MazE/SpoVT family DNA-binding domain-containing protein [Bacillus sp. FJAT-49705]|uniref:AbrB/MazE/SpoVT family DNA-binding domain-containing protein n=1 Tax=Cytobacillus citreus TaxID=2833586 RepID=A0ABS5NPL2_9BACI|nr:AbrB/MazE/SpoVT family DNA-binding domain-containing protein [Cytobacillus citreus]MBS4189772.1 AbrB/MazE/SpoVT family DNA-binding domain-containing protein [Cytobacillus citreus]
MKSTGVVRKVDELGRIVLPKELRRTLEINEKDPLEIFIENEKIILQKYKSNMECVITGEISDENKIYSGNIILSAKGADILMKEINTNLFKPFNHRVFSNS